MKKLGPHSTPRKNITWLERRLTKLWARWRLTCGIAPLSYQWGTDRGQPVHRYYLYQFLEEYKSDVRGCCLEFQNPQYVPRLGRSAVTSLDILHVDHSNPRATLVADLTRPNDLPNEHFDCIVCTHILHVIFDVRRAVSELHRILKPDGVLLVAVPHVSMSGPEYDELWRFTPKGLHRLLGECFGVPNTKVKAYGNSLTAAGDLRGVIAAEFSTAELHTHDERFAVEVCGRAVKREP